MFRKSVIKIMATIMAVMVIMLAVTLTVIYITSAREIYQENQERLETYIEAYEENGNPGESDFSEDITEENAGIEAPAVADDPSSEFPTVADDPSSEFPTVADDSSPNSGDSSSEEGPAEKDSSPAGPENPPETDSDAAGADSQPQEEPRSEDDVPVDDPPDQAYVLSTFYSALFYENEILQIDNSDDKLYTDEQICDLAAAILELEKEAGTWHNLVYRVAEMEDGSTLVVMMDNTVVDQSVFAFFRYTLLYGGIALIILLIVSFFLARRIVRPLQEGYERQKRFISDAGHELKTPVSAASANLDILKREVGENPWIDNIEYENRRMAGIVTQLLELSRAENTQPGKTKTDFSRLVTSEVLSFESVAFERGFRLNYDGLEAGISVHGNEQQLSQLISILLDNAVDHADGSLSDRIEISLSEKRGKAILIVTNAGAPIPEEERERIFERFYRSDSARSGEGNHYGLGLSIARAIVSAHRGTIRVSCRDGKISFTVIL